MLSKRLKAWLGKSECASLRQNWRPSQASPSVSSCHRVLRVTETRQQKRIELLETLTSMEHLISRRWSRREICRCARCGRAGCPQRWKLELTTCTAVLARHDDRWVEESTIRVSIRGAATMKTCSAKVEHLMLRWGKVTGTNRVGTTRQKEEYHTNKLVLGTGVVHHSHETWLLRGIKFCGKCVAWRASAPRPLIKPCTYLASTRACDLTRLSRGQEPSDTPLVSWRMYISTPDQGDPGVDAAISRGVTGTQGRDASQTMTPPCVVSLAAS